MQLAGLRTIAAVLIFLSRLDCVSGLTPMPTGGQEAQDGTQQRMLSEPPSPSYTSEAANSETIADITFVGLRRIPPETVQAHITARVGEKFDRDQITRDVRALARLSWFSTVRVEQQDRNEIADKSTGASGTAAGVRLAFIVEENPLLVDVKYSGSRLLNQEQIEKLLEVKKIHSRTGGPSDPAALHKVAEAIRGGLLQLGYPEATVQVVEDRSRNATVQVRFEINDGPHLTVGRVRFEGHPEIPSRTLEHQMQRIGLGAFFAGLRGKSSYTPEGFEQDRARTLEYFQNHGYPEARIGDARVSKYQDNIRRWWPWPHEVPSTLLEVAIPVEAGPLYRIDEVQVGDALEKAAMCARKQNAVLPDFETGRVFSAEAIENGRRFWQALAQPIWKPSSADLRFFSVEARQTKDTTTHTVHVEYDLDPKPAYAVRRIEFLGIHRFPDSYFRKRIGLQEGAPFDDRVLEAGLKQLDRTNYFKAIKKEDIHVEPDETERAVDVTIKIEERGQQRMMLTGGQAQFGSTLGIAYTVFNMLGRQELISSHFDGGSESLQLAMGFTMEGVFGSRASVAFSLFNTFLRPALTGSVQGPFFRMHSEGVNADWTYPLSKSNAIRLSYGLSLNSTQYSSTLPPPTGLDPTTIQANSTSHWVGAGFTHDTGGQRITTSDSVSGGFLGGSENLLRSSGEYARIIRDPIFNSQNAWAFRTTFSAVGSYSGAMPFYTGLFPADEFVRGLNPGDLGPQEVLTSTTSSGATTYSTTAAGANLITAANAEYRVPLKNGVQMAGFFDIGAGRMLPNWLGQAPPALVQSTNGLLHGSTGIELRWTVPGFGIPARFYYSLNVLRLSRFLPMPDGSLFPLRAPFSKFGWGLGSLF